MSCITKRNTATELIGFTYPKLHEGKSWYVDFYALDPSTGEMRRKKFKLDGIPRVSEKRRRAAEIIEAVTRQLRQGWNPWVNTQESRGLSTAAKNPVCRRCVSFFCIIFAKSKHQSYGQTCYHSELRYK